MSGVEIGMQVRICIYNIIHFQNARIYNSNKKNDKFIKKMYKNLKTLKIQ